MPEREAKQATISAYGDQRWSRLMEAFQHSRDAQIERDGAEFSDLHQRHYDELLDKIVELAGRV
jgi:hypothetical protein